MIDDLMLLSGIDIPFPEAELVVHQPTLREIAYINEETFFKGCELLLLDKSKLEDKARLEHLSNFEIIMSIMNEKKDFTLRHDGICALMVLVLLFPEYDIKINQNDITLLFMKDHNVVKLINNNNFNKLQEIITNIFCLADSKKKNKYNPKGNLAAEIAKKLQDAEAKRSNLKGEKQKLAILSRYASILAVGENKNLNELMSYTMYQLFDEFQRYEKKMSYDMYLKARMMGAKDLEEVDNWMTDIHP